MSIKKIRKITKLILSVSLLFIGTGIHWFGSKVIDLATWLSDVPLPKPEEPKPEPVVAEEPKSMPVEKETKAEGKVSPFELPLDLYIDPFFIAPTHISTYGKMMQEYRNDLIDRVADHQKVDHVEAELIVNSMVHWVNELSAGKLNKEDAPVEWFKTYADFSRKRVALEKLSPTTMANSLINTLTLLDWPEEVRQHFTTMALEVISKNQIPHETRTIFLDLLFVTNDSDLLQMRLPIITKKLGLNIAETSSLMN